jgi:hypothetical protein
MPAPYLLICLLPTEQGRFVPQQPRFPGDDRDSWIVARPGWREAGRPTHAAAARFAEHPALAIRNLSGLFRINAAIGGCFVSGFGDHRFSTGPAQSLPTRLGHAALAVADDGGSGT